MKAFLLYQTGETCGENLAGNLRKFFPFKESGTFDNNPLLQTTHSGHEFLLGTINDYMPANGKKYSDLVKPHSPDVIIHLIWHEGTPPKPLLTCHPIGNPTTLDRGDETHVSTPKTFSPSNPSAMKSALLAYSRKKDELSLDEYEVCLETTHGSPTDMEIPFMDLEIGSDEERWKDPKAGEAGAHAAMSVFDNQYDAAIGFGDLHYTQKFTDVMLNSDVAVGHMFPSYSLLDFSKETLESAIKSIHGNVKYILLNKKEKGEYKDRARQFGGELGLEVLNHKQVLKEFQ